MISRKIPTCGTSQSVILKWLPSATSTSATASSRSKVVHNHRITTRQSCNRAILAFSPPEFAERLAPLAGFRNVLAHQYLGVDWDEVYSHLQKLDDLD